MDFTALWGGIEKEFGESREMNITRAGLAGRVCFNFQERTRNRPARQPSVICVTPQQDSEAQPVRVLRFDKRSAFGKIACGEAPRVCASNGLWRMNYGWKLFLHITKRGSTNVSPPIKKPQAGVGLTALWGVIEKEFGESREMSITPCCSLTEGRRIDF